MDVSSGRQSGQCGMLKQGCLGDGCVLSLEFRGHLWDLSVPAASQQCSSLHRITEDSAVTTFEALKARVRELERQLSRGDRYKCLICMVSGQNPGCPRCGCSAQGWAGFWACHTDPSSSCLLSRTPTQCP